MAKNKKDLIIQSTCEVWAVSYMSETGLFNTWGLYGTEKTARKIAKELEKIRKVPTKTNVTAFIIDVEQNGVFGDIKVIDDPCDV